MTKQERDKREMCYLTKQFASENVKILAKALSDFAQAQLGSEKYGRRAINGLCSAFEFAMSDMDDADRQRDE